MTQEIELYIKKKYDRWHDYALFHCTRAGIPDEAGDVLNTVLIDLLKKPDYLLLKLLKSKKKEGTELDFFILRMIRINAFSPTSPYRYSTKGLPIDSNVEYTSLEIADTPLEETDRAGETFDKFQLIRKTINELNLSPKARSIFQWKFFEENSFSNWPGKESLNELYSTYNKVIRLLREKIGTLQKIKTNRSRKNDTQLSLF